MSRAILLVLFLLLVPIAFADVFYDVHNQSLGAPGATTGAGKNGVLFFENGSISYLERYPGTSMTTGKVYAGNDTQTQCSTAGLGSCSFDGSGYCNFTTPVNVTANASYSICTDSGGSSYQYVFADFAGGTVGSSNRTIWRWGWFTNGALTNGRITNLRGLGFNTSVSVPVNDSLSWSGLAKNDTTAGGSVNFSVSVVAAGTQVLNSCTLSLDNGTGAFVNVSTVGLSGTSTVCSVATIVNGTVGSSIRALFYFNSTNGSVSLQNVTSELAFNTTGITYNNTLTYDNVSVNSTRAGNTSLFTTRFVSTGNVVLSNCTFSLDNGTGAFVNVSVVNLSATGGWCNASARLNPTVGSLIRWYVTGVGANGTVVFENVSAVSSFNTTTSAVYLFFDDAETGAISENWTFIGQGGSGVSQYNTSTVYAGSRGFRLYSSSTTHYVLEHEVGSYDNKTYEAWIYDDMTSTSNQYTLFGPGKFGSQGSIELGYDSYISTAYYGWADDNTPNGAYGNVSRTLGWHFFQIHFLYPNVAYYVDNQVIFNGTYPRTLAAGYTTAHALHLEVGGQVPRHGFYDNVGYYVGAPGGGSGGNVTSSYCGDGVVDAGEACDDAGANGDCFAACSLTCVVNQCKTSSGGSGGGGGGGGGYVPPPVVVPNTSKNVSKPVVVNVTPQSVIEVIVDLVNGSDENTSVAAAPVVETEDDGGFSWPRGHPWVFVVTGVLLVLTLIGGTLWVSFKGDGE